MSLLEGYLDPVEGSRRLAVQRAQAAGRYEALHGVQVVTGYNARSGVLYLAGQSGARPVSGDVLGLDERRLLFRASPGGLGTVGGWLPPRGLPEQATGWQRTFRGADARRQGQ